MTLQFQVRFLKLKCAEKAKSASKNPLKIERSKKRSSLKKYHQKARKKIQGAKERYYRDPES